ncbi:mitofusin [Cytospora paraplurivora]|uniref:Mitofusin n=1 Tax=Cytospora paraplurivora TaxID=2898453 RepID=A0AAN9YEG2_9PEZI
MSQDYFAGKGKSPSGRPDDESSSTKPDDVANNSNGFARPGYMTVGSGSTSKHAAHLQELLERDSGYGGSVASGSVGNALVPGSPAWDSATHPDTPTANGPHRRTQPSAVHQLWYNQHRGTLNRAINKVIDLLKELQQENVKWPAHYPSVQRAETETALSSPSRPKFTNTFSHLDDFTGASPSSPPPPAVRRAMTWGEDQAGAESSRSAERRTPAEPRLVTPQIAQEFSVLKLDLKLGSLHQTQLVHSLEKGSIAALLDGKISTSIKHLLNLRERIEDTSSKVLVTGDLNAGKSTFCNALLRKKVLPEDQQPCTSIFCEVLDARENANIEEVHAVHKDAVYDRNDETTYDVYTLYELEKIVIDDSQYTICKVYVKDVRTIDESLLNNGVVDIALIDAPGLNSDTTKTTAVFARQEEIDVVVFVVSAANHFTQSAKEFLWAAAAEKAYLFIVVNGFDMIRDQQRCQKMILDQVAGISPRTSKEAEELVHFVSSNAIPMAPSPPGGPDGSGNGSASGGGGGDYDPGDDSKGKGKDKEKVQNFQNLEQSLRRFVLEKRARSKLAPAKHYLLNILTDVNTLATVNADVAQSEVERVGKELRELEPQLEASKKAQNKITEDVNLTIDETCDEVYQHTRSSLNEAILHADEDLDVPYPGLFQAFDYAEQLKEAMLQGIQSCVNDCEEFARGKAVGGVNAIRQLGILHLGNEYTGLNFHPDVMFRRRRDVLAKQIDIPTEFSDFVDWSTLMQRQEKVAGTGMALTVATAVGTQMISGYSWVNHALSAARIMGSDNLRRLIIPGIFLVAIAAGAYVVNQIPHSLPHRLSNKISTQLASMEYVHHNAHRIAGSVRKVLHTPKDHVVFNLQRSVEQLGQKREETLKVKKESHEALKYFTNLVRESGQQRSIVQGVDLENHPVGATH